MRRVPVVAVAVMAAMVMTAVLLKCSARRSQSARAAWTAARARADGGTRADGSATEPSGLGAGPPPGTTSVPTRTSMLHGDAHHTHRASARVAASTPVVAWTRDVGGPVEAQVTASPDEQTLYVASLGGTLTALGRDGAVRWTLALGDRGYATPCVADDGTIYVGSDAKKFDALSPDGKVKWALDTDGDADTGAAIAFDGSIVFAAGRTVYGVTPSGYVRWRFAAKRKVFTAPALASPPTNGATAITAAAIDATATTAPAAAAPLLASPTSEARVYFGSQDHHVYALTLDGRLVWSIDLGADVDGAPALGDQGEVFVGTDGGEVVRLDPSDGHAVWRTNVGGYVRGALSVARNGDILAGVYGPVPRAVRLRGGDGIVRGDFPIQGTGAREFGVHGGALEDADGTLVFGTQDNAVYAVGSSGQLLWRYSTGGDVDAPATLLSDGTLVIGSDDGFVTALLSAARPAGRGEPTGG